MAVNRGPCSTLGGKTSRLIFNLYSIPPPIRLAARKERAAFGFALAIARTSAKDLLAYASASRLDPTPAVTVGRLQPLRVFRNALCVPVFFKRFLSLYFIFCKKASKRKMCSFLKSFVIEKACLDYKMETIIFLP